jgi:hypothetical protein
MEILTELVDLTKEGFYVTILCMFLFWLLPIQNITKKWILEATMRIIIVLAAFIIIWFGSLTPIWEWTKPIWKQTLIAIAFSVLFYEFAGKFVVKKWFNSYKVDKTKMS